MKTTQKIVNNSINDNIFPLNVSSRWVIFGDNQFISKYVCHRLNPLTYMIQFCNATHTHILNGYDQYHNISDFQYARF